MSDVEPSRSAVVFNHIPKTAGTALAEALVEALHPAHALHALDGVVFGDLALLGTVHPKVRAMVLTAPEEIPLDADFVTGHISPSTTMSRLPAATHVTVLREPRTRIVSLWLFSRSRPSRESRRLGAYGDRIRRSALPLVDYLADPAVALAVDNMITRFLVWPHPLARDETFIDPGDDETLLAAARERLERFDHVGVVEDRRMAERLGAFLGAPLAIPRRNETPSSRGGAVDVAAEVETAADLLSARSRLDRQLWDQVAASLLPGEDLDELADRSLAKAVSRYAVTTRRRPWFGGRAR